MKIEGGSADGENDKNVFAATMTILGLIVDGTFVWINSSPNGIRNNRPVHFQFTKETHDVVKKIVGDIQDQMEKLSELDITFEKNGESFVLNLESMGKFFFYFL